MRLVSPCTCGKRVFCTFLVTYGGVTLQFESFNNNCYRTCNYNEHDILDIEKLIQLLLFAVATHLLELLKMILCSNLHTLSFYVPDINVTISTGHKVLFLAHAGGSGNKTSVECYELKVQCGARVCGGSRVQ